MALRNIKQAIVKNWLGLQTFASQQNIAPEWWRDSSNIIVTNDGSSGVLRSPANFNIALSPLTGNPVYSAFDYDKSTGNSILFDINIGAIGAASVATYQTTGVGNSLLRSNQADARWKSLLVNDFAYRLNGSEFVQTNGPSFYAVGINSPASAPTLSFVAGGSGSLVSGITASYAYRNSTTGHVSQPSPVSNNSGASAASLTLRTAVAASTQTGVDGIVLFFTEDGGSVRYLYTNSAGDPIVNANSTANIDISIALLVNIDTLTPETAYNAVPPQNATFMFRWGDRLCLCGFTGATTRQQIQYNIYENCYYGIPWESWWPFNIVNYPSKGDRVRGGIETPIGALILAEQDACLIRGSLTDKVSAPEATVSVTEHIQPMKWSIGTKSPYTIVSTPFGEIWLDQNKRIQLWDRAGFPTEVGLPIRTSLKAILDTDAARAMAEAVWFQHGDSGGHYILTASTSGTTNNKLFIISVYKDPETGDDHYASSVSDIAAQSLTTAEVNGKIRMFVGVVDRLREIMDLSTAGAGWGVGQLRFFESVYGNDDTFAYWHSFSFDISDVTGLTVTVADQDGQNSQSVTFERENEVGPYYGIIDAYGYRKIVRFEFDSNDSTQRILTNLRVNYSPTTRII